MLLAVNHAVWYLAPFNLTGVIHLAQLKTGGHEACYGYIYVRLLYQAVVDSLNQLCV